MQKLAGRAALITGGNSGIGLATARLFREEFVRKSPAGRFGSAEEVALVALFLATADSSYVVGAEIVVDGGFSLPL